MTCAPYAQAFLAATSVFLMVGCGLLGPSRFIREADYTETIRVACVGNSVTYGAKIPIREKNSYPAQLGELLGDRWDVRNFGVTGATLLKKGDMPYWKEPAFYFAQKFEPHVVIIMLGTNDTKPQNWKHARAFVDDYVEMIRAFAELKSRPRIWICYPVPAYPGRSGIRDSIINPEVLAKIDQIAAKTGRPIIDLYEALSDKPELFPDRIHPNAAGARVIAETIHTAADRKNLGSPVEPPACGPSIRCAAVEPAPTAPAPGRDHLRRGPKMRVPRRSRVPGRRAGHAGAGQQNHRIPGVYAEQVQVRASLPGCRPMDLILDPVRKRLNLYHVAHA